MDYDELECAEPIKNQVCPRCLGECWILKGRVGCWFCGGTQDSPGMGQQWWVFRREYPKHVLFKAYIPNIHALNSDTHTLRIQYEYTQKQSVGVAIEGIDIWYTGLINFTMTQ